MPMYPTKNIFSLRINKINHIPSSGKVYYKNYTSKLEANDNIICKTRLKYFDIILMLNEVIMCNFIVLIYIEKNIFIFFILHILIEPQYSQKAVFQDLAV